MSGKTSDKMSDFQRKNVRQNVRSHFDFSRTKSLWASTFDINVKGLWIFFIPEIKTSEKQKRQVKRQMFETKNVR